VVLLGLHIQAVGIFHECLDASGSVQMGSEFVSGIRFEKMAVIHDGMAPVFKLTTLRKKNMKQILIDKY
jgi:hypothetical protein